MDIPEGVEIHPGDSWFVRPLPIPSIEAPDSQMWHTGFADVVVRKAMPPHYRLTHSYLYKVIEGGGYLITGERENDEIVRWHARLVRPGMMLSIDPGEPHFFLVADEGDLHLYFVGTLAQSINQDRYPVPWEELSKPTTLHIKGRVLGYEGTTANIELEDGTLADLHDANKMFGVKTDFEPGQVVAVDLVIDWLASKAREAAREAETMTQSPEGQ